MQCLSAFLLFFFCYKKEQLLKSSCNLYFFCLDCQILLKCLSESRKRYIPRILLLCLRREGLWKLFCQINSIGRGVCLGRLGQKETMLKVTKMSHNKHLQLKTCLFLDSKNFDLQGGVGFLKKKKKRGGGVPYQLFSY